MSCVQRGTLGLLSIFYLFSRQSNRKASLSFTGRTVICCCAFIPALHRTWTLLLHCSRILHLHIWPSPIHPSPCRFIKLQVVAYPRSTERCCAKSVMFPLFASSPSEWHGLLFYLHSYFLVPAPSTVASVRLSMFPKLTRNSILTANQKLHLCYTPRSCRSMSLKRSIL